MTTAERPQNKHLIPFQKGQSGNPAGRPKNTPLVTPAMRRMLELPIEELRRVLGELHETGEVPSGFTVAEAIALTTIKDALTTGSFTTGAKSRELLINRVDGAVEPAAAREGLLRELIVREYGFEPKELD